MVWKLNNLLMFSLSGSQSQTAAPHNGDQWEIYSKRQVRHLSKGSSLGISKSCILKQIIVAIDHYHVFDEMCLLWI